LKNLKMAKSKKTPAIDYALKYIRRYPKTEKELRVRLLEKHYSEEEIEKAVQYLKKQWRLDDKKFAQMYIESELIKKWKPKAVVYKKLLEKWIDRDIIEEIFSDLKEEIQEWIINKIMLEIDKLKRKWKNGFDIIQILMRRWYALKDIKKAINKLENEK